MQRGEHGGEKDEVGKYEGEEERGRWWGGTGRASAGVMRKEIGKREGASEGERTKGKYMKKGRMEMRGVRERERERKETEREGRESEESRVGGQCIVK